MTINMKSKRFVASILCALFCGAGLVQGQGMDKEITSLADKMAEQVKASGRKKVAVLDFTDLQGNITEFGRFLAEQVTVSLVEKRSGFSIVDRANLKTILAEHKLTVEGLVEPENAKKLGQFSGVDAIVLGTVTLLQDEVAVTVKIIATDTAEIVGAAKARIPKGKEVEQIPGGVITGNGAATAREKPKAQDSRAISQKFGDLSIVFESLRALDNQTILVNLIFQNKSDKNAIGVGVYCEAVTTRSAYGDAIPILLRSTLLGSDGLQFESDGNNLVGIRPIRSNAKDLIEIPPGEEIKTAFKYRTRDRFSAVSPSFRLQAEIVMKTISATVVFEGWPLPGELPGGCKIHNFVLDIPVRGK